MHGGLEMTDDTRDAIAAAAMAWATAWLEHWALLKATYKETGQPTKAQYAAIMASMDRVDAHRDRLHALARAAITADEAEAKRHGKVGENGLPLWDQYTVEET